VSVLTAACRSSARRTRFLLGREAFTAKLVEEVKEDRSLRSLALQEAASSVVRAGLIPHLRASAGGQVWEVAT
jgi:hypothetical protein